jgi:hypothetical protein
LTWHYIRMGTAAAGVRERVTYVTVSGYLQCLLYTIYAPCISRFRPPSVLIHSAQ